VTVVCPNCNKPHLLEYCFFDPLGKYCYPDVKDAHHADIANGGTGRQANKGGGKQPNNNAPNKAYRTSIDEGFLQEDAELDGNYMVTSGRLNAVTYSNVDEEEVDYSESPPSEHESPGSDNRSQTAVPDAVPAEQEEGEVMNIVNNNMNTNDTPDISPAAAPVFVMHIDGVGYTAAMLSSAIAAQTADSKAGKERLKQKGWGTLLPSRSDAKPVAPPAHVPIKECVVEHNTTTSKDEKEMTDKTQGGSPVGKSADLSPSDATKRARIFALIHPTHTHLSLERALPPV
jgi:hypothetical protein